MLSNWPVFDPHTHTQSTCLHPRLICLLQLFQRTMHRRRIRESFCFFRSTINYHLLWGEDGGWKTMGACETGLPGGTLRLACRELESLMSSLFGSFNCAVAWHRQEGAKGVNEERGFKVEPMTHPEMKWVIECRINTANNLGSSSFKRRKKRKEKKIVRKRETRWGKRKGWDRKKIPSTLWGEKLLLKSY